MERKIGEKFDVKISLKVVEGDCDGCIFGDMYPDVCPYIDELGDCDGRTRSDGKNVHFERVSSDES